MTVQNGINSNDPQTYQGIAARITSKIRGEVSRTEGSATEEPGNADLLRGFGPMTRISTSFGDMHAQTLRERDRVRTRSGEFRQIKWIDRIVLGEDYLKYHPNAQPILIRAGSLGLNLPKIDVMLAPFQPITRQQTFTGNAPKRAMDTLGRPNVVRKTEPMITYTRFHCGEPVSVLCEGIWVDVHP